MRKSNGGVGLLEGRSDSSELASENRLMAAAAVAMEDSGRRRSDWQA